MACGRGPVAPQWAPQRDLPERRSRHRVCSASRVWQGLGPLFLLLVVSLGAAGSVVALRDAPQPSDLATFNHAKHVEFEIECEMCHTGVKQQARAGVPSIQICRECHESDSADDLGGTPNARLITAHLESGEELWWPRLYRLPDHVVFSHQRHVVFGEVECETCHGDIARTTTLPGEPVRRTLSMDGCLACHEAKGADVDCLACHR